MGLEVKSWSVTIGIHEWIFTLSHFVSLFAPTHTVTRSHSLTLTLSLAHTQVYLKHRVNVCAVITD